jgi:hypothetical protein
MPSSWFSIPVYIFCSSNVHEANEELSLLLPPTSPIVQASLQLFRPSSPHLSCWWLPSSRLDPPFLCHPSILQSCMFSFPLLTLRSCFRCSMIHLSSCPWFRMLSILPVTFGTNMLSPRRMTDVHLDALDGLVYSMRRFRTCASHIKGLTADILVRCIGFILSFPLDHDLIPAKY